jgi:iron complex transport system ATP-binding protein
MIKAENISYSIRNKLILEDVSFAVQPGEMLAIMGTNGAGKSTLLKILSGELQAFSGKVYLGNKTLPEWKRSELSKIKGVLPQQSDLKLPFRVNEVVMMGRYPHFDKKEHEKDRATVERSLAKTGIRHLAQRLYTELSGGEQQRVHLARVLSQIENEQRSVPHYLLLDEPVSSLDIRYQHHTLRLAKEYASEGNCVIVVIHDLNLAALYADRFLLLKQGKIAAIGTAEDVITGSIISDTFGYPARVEKHPYTNGPLVFFGDGFSPAETATEEHAYKL